MNSSSNRKRLAAFLESAPLGKADDAGLIPIVEAIAAASAEISYALRTEVIKRSKGTNKFGDAVLSVDLLADDCIAKHLQKCPTAAAFCSEERPLLTKTNQPNGAYCVAFDPLDGSSVIPTNFAVGSIFGVWRGDGFVGQRVRDIVASVVVVYGPRTVMFVSHRSFGTVEFLLDTGNVWGLVAAEETGDGDKILVKPDAAIFSPGNMRSVVALPWYRGLITEYMNRNVTLRYTGGMVPDVCQILIKRTGIFMTPASAQHKVKLRVLFECGPMAFMVHCAGGYATTGEGDYLDLTIRELHQRSPIALGSLNDVRRYESLCKEFIGQQAKPRSSL